MKSVKILSKLPQHVSFICQNLIVVTQSDYKQMLMVMKYDSCFIPEVFSETRIKYLYIRCMYEWAPGYLYIKGSMYRGAPGVLYPSKAPCMEGHLGYLYIKASMYGGHLWHFTIKGSVYGGAPALLYQSQAPCMEGHLGYFIHQGLYNIHNFLLFYIKKLLYIIINFHQT